MVKMAIIVKILSYLALLLANICFSEAKILLGSRLYTQNTTTWLSASADFAFGFYKKADGFAVGIWLLRSHNTEPLITWTANRDDPPIPPEAYLEFTTNGRLLLYTQQSILDVFNLTIPATSFSLLDSGNLVAYNRSKVIWQSFDYPTDTILGGQAVEMGYNMYSSVSVSDHSKGRFMLGFQMDGNLVAYPVNVTPAPAYSYWSSDTFRGDGKKLVLTERGEFYLNSSSVHVIANSSRFHGNGTIYRVTFDADGNLRLYSHSSGDSAEVILWSAVGDECDVRGYCGVNSYCSFDSSGKGGEKCFCFPGFIYFDAERKFLGCYRNFTYERFCGRAEESVAATDEAMVKLEKTRIGGYPYAFAELGEPECSESCRRDCNCWTVLYQSGSCQKFRPPLMYSTHSKNYLEVAFVRRVSVDATQSNVSSTGGNGFLDDHKSKSEWKRKRKMILILAPPLGFMSVLLTLLAFFSFLLFRRRAGEYQKLLNMENLELNKEFTLRSFSYSELERATDGFGRALGNVSYGKIYEGIINEGDRKVAVNRLEKAEPESEREFIAEITAMGRVYHKNVVQLVGFCLEGAKRLLVYEFMTNRSLADILYDVERRPVWKQRMKIALDVAMGIRYLHEECDTRIVHCKIKPKNVLVDDDFTAKLCGFGSSKLLKPCEAEDGEKRAYSAPEWRKKELISEKVDVYSYGVLLLEIIFCSSDDEDLNVQNPSFSQEVYKRYFKSKELKLFSENDDEEGVDIDSLERYLKVGLCCVQDDSDLRPSMKNVIMMLEGTLATPIPLPPTESILP